MKKINWLDHTANLLVVILGISIAFYLEGYREDKSKQKQKQKYLESLISDLDTDIQALDTLTSLNKMFSNALVELSDASINRILLDDSTLIGHVYLIQYNPPFTPQRTTFESLKASGKLDLIDFGLRNEILELYEQYYRGAGQYDDAIDRHVRNFIVPFFMKNIEYTSPNRISDAFLTDSEFRNMIFAYRYLFASKDTFYHTTRDVVEDMKKKVEAHM